MFKTPRSSFLSRCLREMADEQQSITDYFADVFPGEKL